MTHVVTDKCIECKYTDCVDVCPVDAFHEGFNMLVINPSTCIDCTMCVDVCPVNAIVSDNVDYPNIQQMIEYAEIASTRWPILSNIKQPECVDVSTINKWHLRPKLLLS